MRAVGLLLMAGGAAFAIPECTVNGKYVNPSNGATTDGITGLMICREDGRTVREEELRDGRFMGVRRFFESDGSVKESHINERGNRDGAYVEKDAQGTVRLSGQYADGSGVGLFRKFYSGGKLDGIWWEEQGRTVASLSFNADGSLHEIDCGERSYFAEDRQPCGFGGKPVTSALYSGRRSLAARETWQSGHLVKLERYGDNETISLQALVEEGRRVSRTFFANGKKRTEISYDPDLPAAGLLDRSPNRIEREWAPAGQIVHQSRFQNGVEVEAEDWYLNGKRGRKMTAESAERGAIRIVEKYRDDGSLAGRERHRGGTLIGVQEYFHPNGKLAQQDRYEMREGGRDSYVAARKTWDESGKAISDESFFEDGSRK